jgi:hypothetical protein
MRPRSLILVIAVVVVVVGAFLLLRPDKLVVDDPVDESLEEAFTAAPTTMAESTVTVPNPVATAVATTEPPATPPSTTSTVAAEPMAVVTGSFFGIDHSAEGTATIYEQRGAYVLRLEDDTDIQNGPDLYVWLTTDSDWDDPDVYLDLGKLKGNVGGQNYDLPAEFDPAVHRNLLIWCLRFSVPFAAAELG